MIFSQVITLPFLPVYLLARSTNARKKFYDVRPGANDPEKKQNLPGTVNMA